MIGGAFTPGGKVKLYLDYLEECLELGLARHVDKISYHTYEVLPEANYENEIRALRAVIQRHVPGIGIWQGESGCPSENKGTGALSQFDWSETRQARWLLRRVMSDLRLEVELTSYFHTVDMVNYFTSGGIQATNFKGVLSARDYSPKPSCFALQNVCSLFDSQTRKTDFVLQFTPASAQDPLAVEALQCASFVRREAPIYVYWNPRSLQVDNEPGRVSLALRHGAAARMNNPVLADLLTGRVYGIQPSKVSGKFMIFESMPLTDYPLVITDQAIVS